MSSRSLGRTSQARGAFALAQVDSACLWSCYWILSHGLRPPVCCDTEYCPSGSYLPHDGRCFLYVFLLRLDWSQGTREDQPENYVELTLTQEEIAQLIGTTRETVTRVMADFKRRNILS